MQVVKTLSMVNESGVSEHALIYFLPVFRAQALHLKAVIPHDISAYLSITIGL